MEARRLAVIRSHLRPSAAASSSVPASLSACASQCSSDAGSSQKDCVFCQIVRGESPTLKLYEDDKCLCILDLNPLCRGHSLIIPKSHFSSLDQTPPSRKLLYRNTYLFPWTILSYNATTFTKFIHSRLLDCADSFNLLVNNGASAGQVIYHTHIHIIPRKTNDCLWNSESLPRYPLKLDKETLALVDRVHKLVPSFSESKNPVFPEIS